MLRDLFEHLRNFHDGLYQVSCTINKKFLFMSWENEIVIGYITLERKEGSLILRTQSNLDFHSPKSKYLYQFAEYDLKKRISTKRKVFLNGTLSDIEFCESLFKYDCILRNQIMGYNLKLIEKIK